MWQIKLKLIEIIALYKYLLKVENFRAYEEILSKYLSKNKKISSLNTKEELEVSNFEPLLNAFRLFLEAPPKDKILGKYILDKMQDFYEDYSKIK